MQTANGFFVWIIKLYLIYEPLVLDSSNTANRKWSLYNRNDGMWLVSWDLLNRK